MSAFAPPGPDVLPGLTPWRVGKVRVVYEAGPQHLVIVATDRLSAYDSILPTPIPGKGGILTQMSVVWFERLAAATPHHFVSDDPERYPEAFRRFAPLLLMNSMLVRRAERIDIECVVRGHLTGSAWREYRRDGRACGIALPPGLVEGARLEPPLFTPATKSDQGHDETIGFDDMTRLVGADTAERLRTRSLAIYRAAYDYALARELVLADTKFEFGWIDDELTLIDEILTPDSSRYWDREAYASGRLDSFDKQIVRDWLDRSGWNHEPPAPALPDDVARRTAERYIEVLLRLRAKAA